MQYYDQQPTQPVRYVRQEPQKNGRRGCGCLSRMFLGGILLLALLIFGGVTVAGTLVYSNLSGEIEDGIAALDAARDRESFETTRVMDRNGHVLWEIFGEGKRTNVPLAQMPQDLINATVSVEDDTFYENIGLDAPSLVAALIANLRNPDERPIGGSTITQQIVRHIVFDYEERTAVDYNRKTKEVILAWMMNRKYTKDEILEMYLNEIYYGNLAYGVEAASQTYFGKSATELTLAEASLLAALPQSPVDLDPLTNLEGAKQRQWVVLNLMVSEGFINQTQAEAAYLETFTFAVQEVSLEAPHFAIYVRQLLEEQFGADVVANGGLRVTTSLDMDYQRLAELLARQHVDSVGPEHNLTNAALVAMKPGTGEILAMLGSVDYHDAAIDGHVNVALTGQQPGSSVKPLTYAAALSPGLDGSAPTWTAADLLWDVPVDYPQFDGATYTPLNYDRTFHGSVRLRDALANSYNVPAVLVLQDIGVPRLVEFAGQMGVTSWANDPSRYGLSLTLGGGEVTPLELTAAYSVFANGGFSIPPTAILKVEKTSGEVLYEYQPPAPQQVIDPRIAYLISDILDDDAARVPAMGRNNPLDLPFPAAAKTGTSNDFRDNWTMGYTPGLVVGVWTGNTDNSEMIGISGLTGAAPLWSAYIQGVYSDYDLLADLANNETQPPTEFVAPPGLEQRPLCAISAITIGATECSRSDSEWFLTTNQATQPTPNPDPEFVSWERIEPAVWRIPAVLLPPPAGDTVTASLDGEALPPPLYCHFTQGTAFEQLPPDVAPLLFLTPPRNPESLEAAYEWAEDHDLPILPQQSCTEEILAATHTSNGSSVWRITSPKAGDTVSGILPIVGTADFNTSQVSFFKVELGIGANPNEWITLGETHSEPVVNDVLEMLVASAFPPGDYALRLVVILKDGNYVGEPHVIPIIIEEAG